MPLQWRNEIWQNLKEDAGKRCSDCRHFVERSCGAVHEVTCATRAMMTARDRVVRRIIIQNAVLACWLPAGP